MPSHPVTTVKRTKDCGKSEAWLRDQIEANPGILGLGDVVFRQSERRQSGAGRLDLLLERPENGARYEVELQLGETDETHIIRTIEYWIREKRASPKRKHTAVLVADEITSRFFNVIQLLGTAVPIIGIQAKMVQIGADQALHFTTIIDTSQEEVDDADDMPEITEKHWSDNYPAAYACAMWYRDLLNSAGGDVRPKFTKGWITISHNGRVRVSVPARKSDQAKVYIQKLGGDDLDEVEKRLNAERTVCTRTEENHIQITGKLADLKEATPVHEWIAQHLVKES